MGIAAFGLDLKIEQCWSGEVGSYSSCVGCVVKLPLNCLCLSP